MESAPAASIAAGARGSDPGQLVRTQGRARRREISAASRLTKKMGATRGVLEDLLLEERMHDDCGRSRILEPQHHTQIRAQRGCTAYERVRQCEPEIAGGEIHGTMSVQCACSIHACRL